MKPIDIVLVLLISIIIVIIFVKSSSTKKEHFKSNVVYKTKQNDDGEKYMKKQFDTKKTDARHYNSINPNFVEVQFHNDYRDTMSAFNNISPSQKQIFNQANVPAKFTNPPLSEVSQMVNDFMIELNDNINNVVTEFRNNNTGWDEAIPDPNIKSGWTKQMEKLGVPTSLYNEPASKSAVKLLKVDHVEKHETEDEIKYTCFLILQKLNVNDQMVVKVSFILTKSGADERNFFSDVKDLDMKYGTGSNEGTKVVVEEIFVLGYLTNKQVNEGGKARDDFYNFDGMENTDAVSQKTIIKELMKKYKQRTSENNSFNATLDEEGRAFHRDLPHLRNYKSYQVTQTIVDDWKGAPAYTTPTYD